MRSSVSSILLAATLAAGSAYAAPPAASGKAAAPAALGATTKDDLASGDAAKVRAALDDVRMGGTANASLAPVVADLLQRGLTAPITLAAIETLGDLESETASPVLATYAQHRNLKVRQAAIRALLKTRGPAATRALRRGLSDADPMIRGLSATGLGAQKAKDALPDLLLALDHRVNEATAAIGQLCGPAECDALTAKLGKLPLDVVTSGLDQAFFRADVGEESRLKVIAKLRELSTAEAGKYLRDVQRRATTATPRVKQAMEQALSAMPGGAQ